MKWWNDAEEVLPPTTDDMLVSDGYDSYAVAWFNTSEQKWYAQDEILTASNHDGGCCIEIDGDVKWWREIDGPVK